MKTTLNFNDKVLLQAKEFARAQGVTLTRFVEDALRAKLMPVARSAGGYRFDPPIVRGDKPPAVDVADRNDLYDFLHRE